MKIDYLRKSSHAIGGALCFVLCMVLLGSPVQGQVSDFPYHESFESNFGIWQQDGADDFNWVRRTGNTGTGSTGPNYAHHRSYYLLMDANDGNNGETANIYAEFDLTGMDTAHFSFYYFMYGSQLGSFYVDVYNGTWNNVWSVIGQEQTWQGAPYNHADIDLTAYTGDTVQIRFRGVVGSGNRSDIVVDSITLNYTCATAAGTAAAETIALCDGSSEVDVSVSGASGTIQWQRSFNARNFEDISGANASTYSATGLNADTTYYYRAKVSDGCYNVSNTLPVRVASTSATTNSFPQIEDFEIDFGIWNNRTTDDFNWVRRDRNTPTSATGPNTAYQNDFFFFLECNDRPGDYTHAILDADFGIPASDSAWLNFNYYMYGSDIGTLSVLVNDMEVWSTSGQIQSSGTDAWSLASIDLTAYAGCNVNIAFKGETTTGNRGDIAIDLVEVDYLCSVAPGSITANTYSICDGSDLQLSLSGQSGGSSIKWQQSTDNVLFSDISGATGSNATVSGLTPGSIYYFRAKVTNNCADYSNTLAINVTNSNAGNNTYPQQESFELGMGVWQQSSTDDFNWGITSGNTGTSNTGPDGAQHLQYYVFMDANNRTADYDEAVLETYLDIPDADSVWLNFYYHMHGEHMGDLYVEVNDLVVWSMHGEQHASRAANWSLAAIDLSAYHGCNVKLSLRGVTATGNRGDIAIDNIEMNYTCNTNAGYTSSSKKALCVNGTVDLSLTNYASGASIQWQQSTDNANFVDIAGADSNAYTTDTLLTGNYYYFRAVVEQGCFSYSDTVAINVGNSAGGISILPYNESFEVNMGDWVQSTTDQFDWTRRTGNTPTGVTGPNGAYHQNYYLYIEANNNNNLDTAAISTSFDFTNVPTAQLSFNYHMYGSGIGSLHVDVNGLEVWSISGQQQSSNADAWGQAVIDIDGYEGCNVEVTIRATTLYSNAGDIAIDNISMEKICAVNPGAANISDYSFCAPQPVTVTLSGFTPGSTLQWQQSTDNQNYSDIVGATSATYQTDTLATGSNYFYRAYVTNGCFKVSDTVSVIGTASGGAISTFPYTESFESGKGGWGDNLLDDFDWTRRSGNTPTGVSGPNRASDGNFYLYVEGDNNFPYREGELSHTFDFSNLSGPSLTFDYHMYGANMGTLELYVNGLVLWSRSGQQHGGNGAAWSTATVDLSNYARSCKVVISFKGTTELDRRTDMAIDNITITDDGTFWTGAVDTVWTNPANWSNGLPSETTNVIIPDVSGSSNNYPDITSGSNLAVADILIEAGADLKLQATQTLTVYGNWTNEGDANIGLGEVIFSGSSAQLISGHTVFYNLTINNSSGGVTLQDSARVTNSVTFTNGALYTFDNKELVLADDATSTEGNSNSFVDGPVLKEGNDNFTFPVGNNGVWAPIGISDLTGTDNVFRAVYTNTAYANLSVDPFDVLGLIDSVSRVEYWDLNRDEGSSTADVTLYWKDAARSRITNYSTVVVAHYNGLLWENLGAANISSGTAGSVTVQNVDDFSPFTHGSSGGGSLPVTLVSFTGEAYGESIWLDWETQVEINNDHFEIERSADGINFERIGDVLGAGNTSVAQFYNWEDKQPINGVNYYRLRQIDFDGTAHYTDIISVHLENAVVAEIKVYPNPSTDVFFLDVANQEGPLAVKVYNETGILVLETQANYGSANIDLANMQQGIYFMQVINEQLNQVVATQKLLKH